MKFKTVTTQILSALAFAFSGGAAHAVDFIGTFQKELYDGKIGAAAERSIAEISKSPSNDTAQFALGVAKFLGSVEGLVQSFYRFGIYNGAQGSSVLGLAGLPLFRLPVPSNPNPDPVSYTALREALKAFGDGLAKAESTLADTGNRPVDLPLDLARIRLDLDGNGKATETEGLLGIFQVLAGPIRQGPGPEPLLTDFDASDAAWLQAYSHLLMAMVDFLLAHDWEEAYMTSFHSLFPDSFTPQTPLSGLEKELQEKLAELPPGPQRPDCAAASIDPDCQAAWAKHWDELATWWESPSGQQMMSIKTAIEFGSLADLIAFVHLNHWRVIEPVRMERCLGHLENMVALSRENWRRILSEADNSREWIPNPKQSGVITGMPIDQARVDGWLAFLDELDLVLKGEKLLPHWRLTKGFNLRRMFLEPRTFDIVLLAQGSAIFPYLEDGPVSDSTIWLPLIEVFGGDFFSYFVWIN